jgi:hypothetical protein
VSAEAVRIASAEPGRSLGIGLAVMVVTPLAAGIAAVTVVGTPVALVAIVLWLVLLAVGYLAAALALGEWGLRRFGREPGPWPRFLALLAVLSVLGLVRLVPFLGTLVRVAAMALGMGAIAIATARRRRAGSASPGAPATAPGAGGP